MIRVALTGGIACGKSLVGTVLAKKGIPICDADELARKLLEPGNSAYREVVSAFGKRILTPANAIDRGILAGLVFSDRRLLSMLNGIIHPHVKRLLRQWLRQLSRRNVAVAVAIVPLLCECSMSRGWDAIVCVASPRSVQIRRLRSRGLSRSDAELRIRAQMPLTRKIAMSDYVIMNSSTIPVLEEQTRRVMDRILEECR